MVINMIVKKQYFESNLPSGYKKVLIIDGEDTKYMVLFSLVSCFLLIVLTLIIKPNKPNMDDANLLQLFEPLLLTLVYIVMHESVHAFVYKIVTKKKLTFGFNFIYAYCGIPNVYVYRIVGLISAMAPFLVFNIVFVLAINCISNPIDRYQVLETFVLHIAGCVPDIYSSLLLLFKYRDKAILIKDEGTKQILYCKESSN